MSIFLISVGFRKESAFYILKHCINYHPGGQLFMLLRTFMPCLSSWPDFILGVKFFKNTFLMLANQNHLTFFLWNSLCTLYCSDTENGFYLVTINIPKLSKVFCVLCKWHKTQNFISSHLWCLFLAFCLSDFFWVFCMWPVSVCTHIHFSLCGLL